MYHFRFYAVFVIWKTRKKQTNTRDVKAEVFFPPAVFFYAVAKRLYFSISLEF